MNNKIMKPKADYTNYKDKSIATTFNPSECAWARVLDARYGMEVQRVEPYRGKYCIFDLDDNDRLIFSEDVNISHDAIFGPDIADVYEWSERGIEIIDGNI